jgi:hypothetical protein
MRLSSNAARKFTFIDNFAQDETRKSFKYFNLLIDMAVERRQEEETLCASSNFFLNESFFSRKK